MTPFEWLQHTTRLDAFALANVLFFGMVLLIWAAMGVLERRDRRPLPPPARWSGVGEPGKPIGPA